MNTSRFAKAGATLLATGALLFAGAGIANADDTTVISGDAHVDLEVGIEDCTVVDGVITDFTAETELVQHVDDGLGGEIEIPVEEPYYILFDGGADPEVGFALHAHDTSCGDEDGTPLPGTELTFSLTSSTITTAATFSGVAAYNANTPFQQIIWATKTPAARGGSITLDGTTFGYHHDPSWVFSTNGSYDLGFSYSVNGSASQPVSPVLHLVKG